MGWRQGNSTITSLPFRSRTIGDSVVLQTLWRSVVLPALARPMTRMRNRGNLSLIAAASFGMTRIRCMSENAAFVSWLGGYEGTKRREERKLAQWMLPIHCTPWTAGPRNDVNPVIQMDLGRCPIFYLDTCRPWPRQDLQDLFTLSLKSSHGEFEQFWVQYLTRKFVASDMLRQLRSAISLSHDTKLWAFDKDK